MKSILKFASLFVLVGTVLFVSCSEEEPTPAGDPIATFTFKVDPQEDGTFLKVGFNSDGAQNASTYAWDFGDMSGTSTEANPEYTYQAPGDYTVSLIVKNADGKESNNFTASFTLADPDIEFKKLTGDVSKTWVLIRDGSTAMSLGPDADNPASWWEGSSNNGQRPCLYYQEFTFGFDKSYKFDDKGNFWAEFGVFNGIEGCDQTIAESCFDVTGGSMQNECGDDVSAWLTGEHTFEYDPATGAVVLTGDGAWIGIPKLDAAGGYRIKPTGTTTFTIDEIILDDGVKGYDQMNAHIQIGGDYWDFTYAHYTGTVPNVVDDFVPPACDPEVAVNPAIISHTFASNEVSEWKLMQFDENSGSGLVLGVDDPTDADATKVGKYVRNADVPYQEQQFKLSPVNAIDFTGLTTITMDVYLPSTNDYENGLTKNVFVGFGATKCQDVFKWFENQIEYQAMDVALNQWVTITLQLDAPGYVHPNNPEGVTNVYGRNDLDMIYINFGGGNHPTGAEFFMRNFKIE